MKQQKGRAKNIVYRNVSFSEFGFLSWIPVVIAACKATEGPILELGGGYGSSLALHGVCAAEKREILTLENDKTWVSFLQMYGRKWHKFKHVAHFIDLAEYKRDWGLALVDHGILGERGPALNSLAHVPIVVAHDTCHEALNYTNDGLPQVLDSFKYRHDHRWMGPKTSVLSNFIDVDKLFKEMEL